MTSTAYEQGDKLDQPAACNAWLDPDGQMYFVRAVCDHDYVAEIILGDNSSTAEDILTSKGWLRISQAGGSYGYVRSFYSVAEAVANGDSADQHMTQAQLNTLFDVFKDASTRAGFAAFATELATILGISR